MTHTIIKPLTPEEQSRKAELETVIQGGVTQFLQVGQALMEMRDSELFREEFGTFEQYCNDRWNFDKSTGYRLMKAFEVSTQTSVHGFTPPNERAARPLSKLKAPEHLEMAAKVLATHEKPDVRAVEAVVKAVQQVSKEEVVAHPETGELVPFADLPEPVQTEVIQQVVSVQERERAEMLAKAQPYARPRDVPPPPTPDPEDDTPPPAKPKEKVYGKDPWNWLQNCLEMHKDHYAIAFYGEWDNTYHRQKWVVKIISKDSSTIFAQGEGLFPRTAVIACIEDFRTKE